MKIIEEHIAKLAHYANTGADKLADPRRIKIKHEGDQKSGSFFCECDEVAMYRLLHKYNFGFSLKTGEEGEELFVSNQNISYGYSPNLKTHFFELRYNSVIIGEA